VSEVIVSTGHSMEASILIVMFLKELGCKQVTIKAISLDHEKVLTKVGADKVIFPERYAAEQLAAKAGHARSDRVPAPWTQRDPERICGG
jgi:trk system potassium uptake protein TrkA